MLFILVLPCCRNKPPSPPMATANVVGRGPRVCLQPTCCLHPFCPKTSGLRCSEVLLFDPFSVALLDIFKASEVGMVSNLILGYLTKNSPSSLFIAQELPLSAQRKRRKMPFLCGFVCIYLEAFSGHFLRISEAWKTFFLLQVIMLIWR